jgi:hypothetical protein
VFCLITLPYIPFQLKVMTLIMTFSRKDTEADKYFLPFKFAIDTCDTKMRGKRDVSEN